jgi:hypothetical protein
MADQVAGLNTGDRTLVGSRKLAPSVRPGVEDFERIRDFTRTPE